MKTDPEKEILKRKEKEKKSPRAQTQIHKTGRRPGQVSAAGGSTASKLEKDALASTGCRHSAFQRPLFFTTAL